MSPAPALVRIADVLKHDGFDAHRLFVLDGVRGRFGDEAVPYLKARMHDATGEEVLSWRRCLNVAPSLLQLLDRSLASSVELVSPERLLKHAFGSPLRLSSLLLLFRASGHYREDRLCLRQHAPWLDDLPQSTLAAHWLRRHRWLLIACQEAPQARLLFESIRKAGRLTARLIAPGAFRLEDGELETELSLGARWRETARCHRRPE